MSRKPLNDGLHATAILPEHGTARLTHEIEIRSHNTSLDGTNFTRVDRACRAML